MGAAAVSVAEESFPEASVAGTSCTKVACDAVAFGWTAAEGFLSDFSPGAAIWDAAAGVGWAETPGLPLLGASLFVAAIDAAVGAGAAEFGALFESRDETLLLVMFFAAAVVAASDERAWAGAVPSVAEPGVGAGSVAVRSPGAE